MGERFVLVKRPDGGGNLVPAAEYYSGQRGPSIISDIDKPFLSMADGKTIIHSRSQYRDHLKAHGCVEVGSELARSRKQPEPNVYPVLKDVYQNRNNPDALRRIAESGRPK